MSDGSQIVLRAAFKPTPSIAQLQKTANNHGENVEISIKGRPGGRSEGSGCGGSHDGADHCGFAADGQECKIGLNLK